ASFRRVLEGKPEIAERISAVLGARQTALQGERDNLSAEARARATAENSSRLLRGLRDFFSVGWRRTPAAGPRATRVGRGRGGGAGGGDRGRRAVLLLLGGPPGAVRGRSGALRGRAAAGGGGRGAGPGRGVAGADRAGRAAADGRPGPLRDRRHDRARRCRAG